VEIQGLRRVSGNIESNLSRIPPNPTLIMKLVGQSSIKPLHDYGMKVVFLAVL
jgi:hypothetical protein